ncbi:MAG: hypothetical protein AAF743_10800 [Planctomycetota bacterium]
MTKPAQTFALTALAAATVLLSGCRMQDRYEEPRVAAAPPVDEAIALRDWPQITAEYQSGDIPAGSVGFLLDVDEDVEEAGQFALQVPTFIGNLVILPVTVFLPPPTDTVVYEGVELAPSHTANPPLPRRATLPTTRPTAAPTTFPAEDEVPPATEPAAEVETIQSAPRRETEPVAPVTPTTREFEK